MNQENNSFRLDRQARSFHVSDFALRDLPLLAVAFAVLTVFCMGVGWFLKFLPEPGRWICLGLGVGFYLGTVFGSWGQRSGARTSCDLSPEVQALAKDPTQLDAAVRLLREAHPGVSLAAAKERIERFSNTGQ